LDADVLQIFPGFRIALERVVVPLMAHAYRITLIESADRISVG
jgi:hypothetical protein